jgi:hypothetical protein
MIVKIAVIFYEKNNLTKSVNLFNNIYNNLEGKRI